MSLLVLLGLLLPSLASSFRLTSSNILGTFVKITGRPSACPTTLDFLNIPLSPAPIPPSSMSVNENVCTGKGGKALVSHTDIRGMGLRLPAMTNHDTVSFFAGVETATRTCGGWAFNASVISWFVFNGGSEKIKDADSGLEVEPGYVYLTYEHFVDFCAYRKKVPDFKPEPVTNDGSDLVPGQSTESDPQEGESDDTDPASEDPNGASDAEGTDEGMSREGESACFPAHAKAQLEDGQVVEMSQLRIGDRVLVSIDGTFSEIYMFSHQDPDALHEFVRIETEGGGSLSLTRGHFLYLNGRAASAGTARVGDVVSTADETGRKRIVGVTLVKGKGLYNPHTMHGDIVVDGVVSTTWTSRVLPSAASLLLLPFRILHQWLTPHNSQTLGRVGLHLADFLRKGDVQLFGWRGL